MMRTATTLAGAALLFIATAQPAAAQSVPPEVAVDSIFADINLPTAPGCAVSVTRDGAPVYQRGYGMANLEYGIPITPQSVFHVASVSKHFTAMAVELLVNDGRVSWDDDIRTYVPEVPDFGTPITLRHLVHHVSGIRDQWNLLSMAGWRWEADVVTQGDVLDITARQTALNFAPGERYLYSNTGFTLLAVVVERVSGKTLREFTRERIFEPLGMDATHFHDDHEMIVRNRAWAYAPDTSGLFGLKNSIPDFDVVGATSLFTTAHDLAAWDRNFNDGRIGGRAALDRLHERFVLNSGDTIDYAHGLSIGRFRGVRTVGHGGADAGYRSQFVRFPDHGLSVAVLCNFPAANPGGRAMRVAAAYLGDALEPVAEDDNGNGSQAASEPTVNIPRADLERLTGVFRGETPNQVMRIWLVDDTLRAQARTGPALRPLGDDRFEVVGEDAVATLRPDRDGVPGTLSAPGLGRLTRVGAHWEPDGDSIQPYVGRYHSAELDTEYRIELDDEDGLVVRHRKLPERPLEPAARDLFLAGGRVFAFRRDATGRVVGFTISDGRVWNVAFERR